MLKRVGGYLKAVPSSAAPVASQELEKDGFTVLRGVLDKQQVEALAREVNSVFENFPTDQRAGDKRSEIEDQCFRYEMLNRNHSCQQAVALPQILETIEPLLGGDCHVIANTAWRNPATLDSKHGGQAWHIDAGPHVPLPEGVSWPTDIPHPIFAIGVHIFLKDCRIEDGPTGVLAGSHLSGQFPPFEQAMDDKLTYNGKGVIPLLAKAGDVAMFVSDIWHRRLPTQPGDQGRFFLQVHYGRRDIAQRLKTTFDLNQNSEDAIKRAQTSREKTIIGLHQPFFYDG